MRDCVQYSVLSQEILINYTWLYAWLTWVMIYMGSQLICVYMKNCKKFFDTYAMCRQFDISERFLSTSITIFLTNVCKIAYKVIIFERIPHWAFPHLISRWFATLGFWTPFFKTIPIPPFLATKKAIIISLKISCLLHLLVLTR